MEISQKTKALCLDIVNGDFTPEKIHEIKEDLASIFGHEPSLRYCRTLASASLIKRVNNLKDVEPDNINTWYTAKNILIRYLASYPATASKECPIYLALVKARDSVNLI